MLNLDQIKQLESRVSKAIDLIRTLKDENDLLKLELDDRQRRIEELENIVLVFKNDQAKIEEGIINALNHLSAFEDTVYQAAQSTVAPQGVPVNELPETSVKTSDVVTEEQPEVSHKEPAIPQTTADIPEAASQPVAPQETASQSNQLDIF